MEDILSLSHVGLSYHTDQGEICAIADLSFSVSQGEFIAVIGPSGCGKSTLLDIISGIISPDNGTVTFRGNAKAIGYMLQRDYLFEWRTIWQNVLLGPEIGHRITPQTISDVTRYMDDYNLAPFADAYPSQLSGGMRQRAALIRTLMMRPSLLLLDEPFGALDYQTRLTVSEDISRIIRNEKITTILVTHDIAEAISLADRIILLTGRPSFVKQDISIDLKLESRSVTKARNASRFPHYFNLLWEGLHNGTDL